MFKLCGPFNLREDERARQVAKFDLVCAVVLEIVGLNRTSQRDLRAAWPSRLALCSVTHEKTKSTFERE
jgi:hypothetical protein